MTLMYMNYNNIYLQDQKKYKNCIGGSPCVHLLESLIDHAFLFKFQKLLNCSQVSPWVQGWVQGYYKKMEQSHSKG